MPDLCKRQHAYITVMLQGTLADVKQLAHITIVQPICVLALLSKCFMAAVGKTYISSLSFCQFWSVIIKYPIFLLFCLLLLFAYVAAFCAPARCKSRDSFLMLKALRNSRETKGNTMNFSSLFLVVINADTPTFLFFTANRIKDTTYHLA